MIIFTPNTVIKSADVNLNFEELKSISVKCIDRKDNTTDNTVNNQLIQIGWGFLQGDGVNRALTKSVTYPQAFDDYPIVYAVTAGYKAGSDPTSVNDINGAPPLNDVAIDQVTQVSFKVMVKRTSIDGNDPGALPAVNRYVFSWLAIGAKAI